ncbi:MAG: hypothetical protein M0033_04745 [Nitrospiraceae bacterium]|nr:hypothetical protein [Nitrospiraceae bacterium]MDA8325507.1 hypothetical protein [Nitrospiraceae bacterium]
MDFHAGLRAELVGAGAAVVGFACVEDIATGDIAHLGRAISIGVVKNLNERTVSLLVALEKRAAGRLREGGYRYLCIPPDSDRTNGTFISRLYPLITHKMAATLSGLGWIGRNGLLINPVYGPRLSFATVLTDAPLATGTPVTGSMCGECTLCMEFCPSHAITGNDWSQGVAYAELVKTKKCASWKKGARATSGKPNCGLCINICPYGRNDTAPFKN